MSKFKLNSPLMLGVYGSFCAIAALGAPIGVSLLLGAGLVVLGRSEVRGADAENPLLPEAGTFTDNTYASESADDNSYLENSAYYDSEELFQNEITNDLLAMEGNELPQLDPAPSLDAHNPIGASSAEEAQSYERKLLTEAPTKTPTKVPTTKTPTNSPSSPTNMPTYAPNTLSPYMVNNSASSGAYSFHAALNYVNSIGDYSTAKVVQSRAKLLVIPH